MIIVEYRVPMPFSAAEYRIGQLYTIAKKSKLESADPKNGVRININEPYSNGPGGCGQYTNKTYYLASRVPDWMKRLLPESASKLKEEAWNAYPYSRNKFTNPLLDKLSLEIESRYLDGVPDLANVFKLDAKEERARSIVIIDIANDKYRGSRKSSSSGEPAFSDRDVLEFDPLFRAPLTRDWLQVEENRLAQEAKKSTSSIISQFMSMDSHYDHQKQPISGSGNKDNTDEEQNELKAHNNLMTCYKLCRVNFPVWPLQSKVEQFIQQYCRDTIIESHRQAWLWQDEWTGMRLDEIREMEKETESHLAAFMRQSSVN